MKNKISFNKDDLQAGLVVFLVALPLCLGIAVASGAPPFAGVITGIIGGVVVGLISKSHVSVTGPAAGLIAIVLASISEIGFESFLLSVIIAGGIQFLLGMLRAGGISSFFPTSVIEGMLVAIGIIIIKKELPHAIGYDLEHEGDFFSYVLIREDVGFWSEIIHSFNFAHTGAILITIISLITLIAFNKINFLKKLKAIPGALVVVVLGIIINELFKKFFPTLEIVNEHLVALPITGSVNEFFGHFTMPSFATIINPAVWITGITIAIVASIETLLCLEAGDKMDHYKRFSDANTELRAQGIGNMISGLIGGLPMTSVIVRTTANINAGAKSKFSAIFHGILLLVAVLTIPFLLNKIPMASLAAILIMIGFKLANVSLMKHMWEKGLNQFLPFLITILAVVFTDLLKGVGIGLIISIFYILKGNLKFAYSFKKEAHHEGDIIHIDLAQEVSFLNKAAIKSTFSEIPPHSKVIINANDTVYIDHDVIDLIKEFVSYTAKEKNLTVSLINFKEYYKMGDVTHVHSEKS